MKVIIMKDTEFVILLRAMKAVLSPEKEVHARNMIEALKSQR